MDSPRLTPAHFPGRPPIDTYGNGGFRFAEMSHRGSIVILPSGVYEWRPQRFSDLSEADFGPVLSEADDIELLLLGTGGQLELLPQGLRHALTSKGLRVEPMDTGAASRTYNVLLAERRLVAAALIAVD